MQGRTWTVRAYFEPFSNVSPLPDEAVEMNISRFREALAGYVGGGCQVSANGNSRALAVGIEFPAANDEEAGRIAQQVRGDLMNALEEAGLYSYFQLRTYEGPST